ncbi:MAG: hypothetical protein M0D55_15085 [Elusimicrobiota bacterium]|nr:MAG: hypothetical protein M0D55_15085 [Elusimicrobiota bacterium]
MVDEASQLDVMGLIALYMADQVVIVGDHEQVSPEAVGQKLDEVQHLIDEHLGEVPNANLYDGKLSVYDLAKTAFGGQLCLREHFRCVEEIIQFSNHLCYHGQIRPLRDSSTVPLKPHILEHRVDGQCDQNNVNHNESLAVASLIAAAIKQPEYRGKTFGAISLLGDEQARDIESMLRRHLAPAIFEERRISVRQCSALPR